MFNLLVKKLGSKEAIDPIRKEDTLWKFIDSSTKKGLLEVASLSGQPSAILDERDLA